MPQRQAFPPRKTGIFFIVLVIAVFNFPFAADGQKASDLNRSFRFCRQTPETNLIAFKSASDKNNIVYPFSNGSLKAIEIRSLNKVWESDLGGQILSAPVPDDSGGENLYIVIGRAGVPAKENSPNNLSKESKAKTIVLQSISKITGLTNWKTPLGTAGEVFLYNYRDKVIAVGMDGTVSAVRKSDGAPIWEIALGEELSAPPFFFGEAVLAASGGKISEISLEGGKVNSVFDARVAATALFESESQKLYWGDKSGNVRGFDLKRKKNLWNFRGGAQISNIALTPKGLLLTSFDNFAYLVSPEKGSLVWKKRIDARIALEPVVIGDYVLLCAAASPEIFILNLADGKPVDQISLPAENFLLSPPLPVNGLLVLSTLKGIFTFATDDSGCSIHRE